MVDLIIGTGNRGKGRELEKLFAPAGIRVRTLADVDDPIDVEETGTTFQENAILKAVEQARHLGAWVMAEDSGLAVNALDGAPGVYSARYAGDDATDDKNNALVLEKLKGIPDARRGAAFCCHMALSDPTGEIQAESEGRCRGRITHELRGDTGFGYDPMFEIREYHKTFAELGPVVKNVLSHRARAAAAILPQLRRLIASHKWME